MNEEMQDYLALKAALKGEIRSAQGRTWWRRTKTRAQAIVMQPVKDYPAMTGRIVEIGENIGMGGLLCGALLVFGASHMVGVVGGNISAQDGELKAIHAALMSLMPIVQAVGGGVVSLGFLVKGMSLMWRGNNEI